MGDDAARDQAWDAYFSEHLGQRDPARGFDYRPFTAGYAAGSAATLARVVANGHERIADLTKHQVGVAMYERRAMADGIRWLLDELEHGALDSVVDKPPQPRPERSS